MVALTKDLHFTFDFARKEIKYINHPLFFIIFCPIGKIERFDLR